MTNEELELKRREVAALEKLAVQAERPVYIQFPKKPTFDQRLDKFFSYFRWQ